MGSPWLTVGYSEHWLSQGRHSRLPPEVVRIQLNWAEENYKVATHTAGPTSAGKCILTASVCSWSAYSIVPSVKKHQAVGRVQERLLWSLLLQTAVPCFPRLSTLEWQVQASQSLGPSMTFRRKDLTAVRPRILYVLKWIMHENLCKLQHCNNNQGKNLVYFSISI